ncbi:MAG TPA: hypothetical protein VFT00_01005, partial [Nocardioides sp.]|nr:hypothetical protein [Nocardioides sp.]
MATDSSQVVPEAEATEARKGRRKGPPKTDDKTAIDPHQARRAMMLIAPTIALLLIVIGYPVGRAIW